MRWGGLYETLCLLKQSEKKALLIFSKTVLIIGHARSKTFRMALPMQMVNL